VREVILEEKIVKRFLFTSLALVLTTSVAIQAAYASHHAAPSRRQMAQQRVVRPREQPAPPLHLAGRVLLPDGAPAPGAAVYLSWLTESNSVQFTRVPVDAEGRFKETRKLTSAPRNGVVAVTAIAPGKGTAWFQSSLGADALADLKLSLQPGVTLSGRLVRTDGSPAAQTELQAEAIFPQGAPNFPAQQQQVSFNRSIVNSLQMIPFEYILRLLPDDITPTLFHTQTDAEGRFTLTGLPPQACLLLRPGGGLTLTPNSMAPLTLSTAAKQDAGILVAMNLGSARIRILNSETHQPEPGVTTLLASTAGAFFGPIFYHHEPPFNVNMTFDSNLNGVVEAKNLLPGTYQVQVLGRAQEIKVGEGQAVSAEFALRQGPLKGHLLDASGKPLANTDIMMTASVDPNVSRSAAGQGRVFFFDGHTAGNIGFGTGWEKQPITRTGEDGTFVLPQFPWGSERVIVRATKNNDRAEYIGPVANIGKTLELRMQPNALVRVTGRLIDPQRRPVTGRMCQALHWQRSLRPTWFASAHEVQADAQGRFHIDGLERGESFSILSNGQRFGGPTLHTRSLSGRPSLRTASTSTQSPVNDFESPRFVANKEGAVQDLGDIMIHPSTTPGEVFQSYGVGNREIANSGVLESPGAPAAAQAQAVLKRYHQAIDSGDLKSVHRLTSSLSPGYSSRLSEFLLHASLRGGMSEDVGKDQTQGALRFVPRSLLAVLIPGSGPLNLAQTMPQVQGDFGGIRPDPTTEGLDLRIDAIPDAPDSQGEVQTASLQRADSAADAAPDAGRSWVFLTAKRNNDLVLAGILHLEAGQWRVVSYGRAASLPLTSLANFLGGALPKTEDAVQKALALPLEKYAAAREAGERYLHLWAENRPEAMLAATSPDSFSISRDLAGFKRKQELRPDEGLCPITSESRVSLQPLPDLTLWEQKWLANLARMRGFSNQMFGSGDVLSVGSSVPNEVFPDSALQRGDLALLQYTTPNGRFLMALVCAKGKWQMLEPALPL
jgi:hypothetical protein